jgi:hypothetical protein
MVQLSSFYIIITCKDIKACADNCVISFSHGGSVSLCTSSADHAGRFLSKCTRRASLTTQGSPWKPSYEDWILLRLLFLSKHQQQLSHTISLPTLASVTISTLALILWPFHAPWCIITFLFGCTGLTPAHCQRWLSFTTWRIFCWKVPQQVSLPAPWRHSLPETAWNSCCCFTSLSTCGPSRLTSCPCQYWLFCTAWSSCIHVTFLSESGPSRLTILPFANNGSQSLPRAVAAASLFCLQVPVPSHCPIPCQHWFSVTA